MFLFIFFLHYVPEELKHRVEDAGISRWVTRNQETVKQEMGLYKAEQQEVEDMELVLSDSEQE